MLRSTPPRAPSGRTRSRGAAEYVRPYVKAQKNDDRDIEAIAEAATRPTMQFAALKSEAHPSCSSAGSWCRKAAAACSTPWRRCCWAMSAEVVVALAAKLIPIAWALLRHKTSFAADKHAAV